MKEGYPDYTIYPLEYRKKYRESFQNKDFVKEFNESDNGKLCYYILPSGTYSEFKTGIFFCIGEEKKVYFPESRYGSSIIVGYDGVIGIDLFSTKEAVDAEFLRRKSVIKKCNECAFEEYTSVNFGCWNCLFFDGIKSRIPPTNTNSINPYPVCNLIKEKNGFPICWSGHAYTMKDSELVCKNYYPSPLFKDQERLWKGIKFHLESIKNCEFIYDEVSNCPIKDRKNRFYHPFQRKGFDKWYNGKIYTKFKVGDNIVTVSSTVSDVIDFKYKRKMFVEKIELFSGYDKRKIKKYKVYTVESDMYYVDVINFINNISSGDNT